MKKFLFSLTALALASGAMADSVVDPDSTGFTFTDVKIVPTTSVKDQNKSGTCWCFSGTSLMENEYKRRTGKDIDLSEMWTVRHCYGDKADRFVRLYGSAVFGPGGSVLDVPYVWERYGMVPEEAYPGNNYGEEGHQHFELDAILKGYVDAVVSKPNKRISTAWRKGYEGVLDAYFGELPTTFVYEGKTYTPKSFAESLGIDPRDFVGFTSYTHHPFYTAFPLEVADNWTWASYQNVPMDELIKIVDNALENDYSVEWAADVSEGGFKWRQGYAVMPVKKDGAGLEGTELARWVKLDDKERDAATYDINGPVEEIKVTQEMRQEMFDRQETTDDHGMVIVGKAVDQNGTPYYKVKNSWNTNQIYDGYFYVSMPYFLAKTLSIAVHKDAVPNDIAKKLK